MRVHEHLASLPDATSPLEDVIRVSQGRLVTSWEANVGADLDLDEKAWAAALDKLDAIPDSARSRIRTLDALLLELGIAATARKKPTPSSGT